MYKARTCGMLLVPVTSEGSCDQLGACQLGFSRVRFLFLFFYLFEAGSHYGALADLDLAM